MLNSTAAEIQSQYDAGKRDFQNLQLRRANLKGLNLSHANLKGADLSYANLRDVDLSGADLSETYLDEADLSGANLQQANLSQASLLKTYLIKSNLHKANLQNAYLTGAYLTKCNLQGALLQGTYLNSTQLTGANLRDAQYNKTTKFDPTLDLQKLGLKDADQISLSSLSVPETAEEATQQTEILTDHSTDSVSQEMIVTVDDFLKMFNHLTAMSQHYLGATMTVRYYKSSRPQEEWLNEFEIDNSAKITYQGSQSTSLSLSQLDTLRKWIIAFVKSCSMIIQNYTQMLDPAFLVFPITSSH